MMRHMANLSNRAHCLAYIVMALLVCTTVLSCVPIHTSILEKMQRAFEKEDSDPAAVHQVLTQDLPTIKDKEVIGVLLTYFKERRNTRKVYFNNVGIVVFYLENVTGLKSHIDLTIAGPLYYDNSNWDKDIAQWQSWWDANKDYIAWDDQSQIFKALPH